LEKWAIESQECYKLSLMGDLGAQKNRMPIGMWTAKTVDEVSEFD
jgi:hypothetical protein